MRIGNLLKNSLIDWEGKLTAVIFTKGCNFRCGFCHNPSLVIPELLNQTEDFPESRIFCFLKDRGSWLDGVVITGGEPTIYTDLPDFIVRIRQLGFRIKLDTNGTNPLMLRKLIEDDLIDFVAMDIKTIVKMEDYQRITSCNDPELTEKIEKSIGILRSSNIQYQFRTTIIPRSHDKDVIAQLEARFKNDHYTLQHYREGKTIDDFNCLKLNHAGAAGKYQKYFKT
ncbi:MAG: anaerobic ribonucleoside-triphosphate reductase activating protein [Bacteroidales bacterium]|nr:anaerobic ribonucleoside-triphosphate reductase activating protein [Bacteroidales bacterium]